MYYNSSWHTAVAACLVSTGSEAVLEHGGIAALVNLLRGAHMEAWASATHTLHMLCSSTPSATTTIMQAGQLHSQVHRLSVQF